MCLAKYAAAGFAQIFLTSIAIATICNCKGQDFPILKDVFQSATVSSSEISLVFPKRDPKYLCELMRHAGKEMRMSEFNENLVLKLGENLRLGIKETGTSIELLSLQKRHTDDDSPEHVPLGAPRLSEDDFVDSIGLITKLVARSDSLSDFLWQTFSSHVRDVLSDSKASSNQRQSALIMGLNQALTSGSMYSTDRFAEVKLRSETVALKAQNPQGEALARLNRFLLVDAYQGKIKKNPLCSLAKSDFAFRWNGPESFLVERISMHRDSKKRLTERLLIVPTKGKTSEVVGEELTELLAMGLGESISKKTCLTVYCRRESDADL